MRAKDLCGYSPFLGPFFFLVVAFFFIPVILIGVISFTGMDAGLQWNFVKLTQYQKLLSDRIVFRVLQNTLIYVSCTLITSVGSGFLIALLTTYFIENENIGVFFRAIWLLPRITPTVVYALLILWILDPTESGLLNTYTKALFNAPPQNWVLDYPMVVIVLLSTLTGASYAVVIFSSSLKAVPRDYIWAAAVDGASRLKTIYYILMPILKWPIMFMIIWQTLSLFTTYELIFLVTDGGPFFKSETWSLYAYHTAFRYFEFGYGAALGMSLVVAGIVVSFLLWRLFRFKKMMEPSKGGD
ncbi:sugar ABC transporter permease [Candidatus Aerophobetes bacterium]|uniref:Sugar ABC transporter permease n=1 Tax=Aerophobetes bacterium TaxID=2030807 RepID=A0A523RNF1_UNCAE|nr:MAG: sugar ABC transporter permease [Candidatus Aerophobetes bacterium]